MTPSLWPQSPVPAPGGASWQGRVSTLAQLPSLRAELRAQLRAILGEDSHDDALGERILLTVDELASNGLRDGLPPVVVRVLGIECGWLIIASDLATESRPGPAVDRDQAHA